VVESLLSDLDGQLMMGAGLDKLKTWGPGALYAALNAHYHRMCVNFKDPGIQMYQTDESSEIRTRAAQKFVQPQVTTTPIVSPRFSGFHQTSFAAPSPRPAVDMSAFLNQGGGCLHPNTEVLSATGPVAVKDLQPGTLMRNGATVRFIIKTPKTSLTPIVWLSPTVGLTPTHPVNDGSSGWVWPKAFNHGSLERCEEVYNVILDADHYEVEAQGASEGSVLRIVALGHGLNGRYVTHNLYGNRNKVMNTYKLTATSNPRIILAS
jgi:hypothetical protein